MRHAGLVAVLVIAWCSSTAARDGSTLDRERTSRTLIESECRTWAQRQVRAEYAPRLQDAARLQWNSALMGSRTFDGVSVATVQGREWELFEELQAWDAALADYEAVAKGSSDSTLRDWARERASAVKARLNKPASGTTPAPSRLSALGSELAALSVVMLTVADPVGSRLVRSLRQLS